MEAVQWWRVCLELNVTGSARWYQSLQFLLYCKLHKNCVYYINYYTWQYIHAYTFKTKAVE